MLREEIYKICSEYPGLKLKTVFGCILIYDSIFENSGYDYFMTPTPIQFHPLLEKSAQGTYCTSVVRKNGTTIDSIFKLKGNNVIGLTPEKLKEYLDSLCECVKKAKQEIRMEALKKDFKK